MQRNIVIITGANSGIGKAAALKFAREGCHVVMACRNQVAGEAARAEIRTAIGANAGEVDLMQVDMASFSSIRSFCNSFKAAYPRLDLLIHNAAYLNHGDDVYRQSPEGVELSFATNTFGPVRMSELLAECLEQSKDPRILHACTTNIKHFFDPKRTIEFDQLQGEYSSSRPYKVYKYYGDSKMALLMMTFKLAALFRERGITVNALQINRVRLSEETIRKMRSAWRLAAKLQNLINPPPSGMADTYYELCTSEAHRHTTGQLFNHHGQILQPAASETGFQQVKNIFGNASYPRYALDARNADAVWRIYEALVAQENTRLS